MKLWIKETDANPLKTSFLEKGATAGIIEGVYVESPIAIERLDRLLEAQEGPVAVPLLGQTEEEILEEAQELFHLSNRILPILTFRPQLLPALHHLFRLDIGVACKVESPLEGWLASKAGASLLIAKELPFVFLNPTRWRVANGREVPLFLDMDGDVNSLFTSPTEVQGAILPKSVFENWILTSVKFSS